MDAATQVVLMEAALVLEEAQVTPQHTGPGDKEHEETVAEVLKKALDNISNKVTPQFEWTLLFRCWESQMMLKFFKWESALFLVIMKNST